MHHTYGSFSVGPLRLLSRLAISSWLLLMWGSSSAAPPNLLKNGDRVVFIGDSITAAGDYINLIAAHLRLTPQGNRIRLINLGLPSETCSGLSEPDHPFPRPDVHERLDRVLAKSQPDVVVACYGMNDGIYHPYSDARFQAYQAGIRRIISRVRPTGARLVLLTPPAFDPLPMGSKGKLRPIDSKQFAWFAIYDDYDSVIQRYAQWVLQQGDEVAAVVDLHTPLKAYLAEKRATHPKFVLSDDGVHINHEGHQVLAQTILAALAIDWRESIDPELLRLIGKRQSLLHDAWLSHVGHQRPGVKAGLPIAEAEQQADVLDGKIIARIDELDK